MSQDAENPGAGGETLVAEYVLGLLDTQAHERVRAAIAADPRLQNEEAFWRARFAALDGEFAETAAPGHVLTAIEQRLFGSTAVASRGGIAGFWNSLAAWRAIAGVAAAVAVVAIGLNLLPAAPQTSGELATQLVAALQAEGTDVQFVALYDGSTGALRLTGLSGQAGPEQDFELWAIQGGHEPISMGVIEGQSHSVVPMMPNVAEGWGEGSVLAITLESEGGSPTGQPQGPLVAQGVATPI